MSDVTHIICILDRSGSMCNQANEVINNFNKFLKEQQEVEGEAKLTLVLFDDQYEMVYEALDLKSVPPLTEATYYVRGMTAMNDAVGRTLNQMQRHNKAIVLIHTDGWENASREYTADQVKTLTDKLKQKWEFIFVGGGIDAQQVGASIGITKTAFVTNDLVGNATTYDNFSVASTAYRSGGLAASSQVDLKENKDSGSVSTQLNWSNSTVGTNFSNIQHKN